MKKILVIHPALVMGGAETVLLNMLKMLGANPEYHVDVLFMENRENHNIHLIPQHFNIDYALTGLESAFLLYLKSVMHSRNFTHKSEGYYQSWIYGIQNRVVEVIKNKIEQQHYDVVIDFQRNYTSMDDYLSNNTLPEHTKLIRWVHSSFELEQRWAPAGEYFQNVLNKCDKIITLCEEMLNNSKIICEKIGVDQNKLDFLFNPQDQDKIHQLMNEVLSNADQKLMEMDYMVQVSRLDENSKNHLQMVDIYHQLKQRGITQKLYIIGDGWGEEALREKINALGLQDDCLLLGKRDNPYPFMKNAQLFIHTAKYEGFGMALTESMACGTPVVAFGCPTGPSEILGYGKYGIVIEPNDVDNFVEQVYLLLNSPEKLSNFEELLPEATERVSFNTLSQKLYSIIDSIAPNNHSLIETFKW